jgi:hypothetical protein
MQHGISNKGSCFLHILSLKATLHIAVYNFTLQLFLMTTVCNIENAYHRF